MKYKLENEYLSLTFDTLGATITSIKDTLGNEYLWQGDETYWKGQAPVLFPICGSIRNNQAKTIDGDIVKMPRHGLVRHLEFECEHQEDNYILFSLYTNHDLYESYPFKFKLMIQYVLKGKEIVVKYLIENYGDKRMPFFIGAHPALNCPLFENETYEDYYLEFEKEETLTIPTPIKQSGLIDFDKRFEFMQNQRFISLSYQLFFVDSLILDQIQSRNVKLKSKKSNYQVEVSFEDFKYLVLWTSANHGPFIAIEPWNGLSTGLDESDIFDEKRNIQYVEPNHTNVYSYSINIISAK